MMGDSRKSELLLLFVIGLTACQAFNHREWNNATTSHTETGKLETAIPGFLIHNFTDDDSSVLRVPLYYKHVNVRTEGDREKRSPGGGGFIETKRPRSRSCPYAEDDAGISSQPPFLTKWTKPSGSMHALVLYRFKSISAPNIVRWDPVSYTEENTFNKIADAFSKQKFMLDATKSSVPSLPPRGTPSYTEMKKGFGQEFFNFLLKNPVSTVYLQSINHMKTLKTGGLYDFQLIKNQKGAGYFLSVFGNSASKFKGYWLTTGDVIEVNTLDAAIFTPELQGCAIFMRRGDKKDTIKIMHKSFVGMSDAKELEVTKKMKSEGWELLLGWEDYGMTEQDLQKATNDPNFSFVPASVFMCVKDQIFMLVYQRIEYKMSIDNCPSPNFDYIKSINVKGVGAYSVKLDRDSKKG